MIHKISNYIIYGFIYMQTFRNIICLDSDPSTILGPRKGSEFNAGL